MIEAFVIYGCNSLILLQKYDTLISVKAIMQSGAIEKSL